MSERTDLTIAIARHAHENGRAPDVWPINRARWDFIMAEAKFEGLDLAPVRNAPIPNFRILDSAVVPVEPEAGRPPILREFVNG